MISMARSRKGTQAGSRRRMAGWALLALAVLLGGWWIASRWWTVGVGWRAGRGQVRVHVGSGRVCILRTDLPETISLLGLPLKPGWDAEPTVRDERTLVWRAMNEGMRSGSAEVADYWLIAWFDDEPTLVYLLNGWLIALWPFPLLLAGGGGVLLWSGARARRQAITGQCAACGYSLAGLAAEATCPECGKAKA